MNRNTADRRLPVTVLSGFLKDYSSQDYIADRGEILGEDDHRPVVSLLIEQVEFCDVTVHNKTDLLPAGDIGRLDACLLDDAELAKGPAD